MVHYVQREDSATMNTTDAQSFAPQEALGSEFNAQVFLIKSLISRMATVTLVQVTKVTNTGGIAAAGTVNLQPLINQVDPQFNPSPLPIIFNCPYFRLQGGTNAIIIDPQVGDIGIALFASRDISAVKSMGLSGNLPLPAGALNQVNPGSFRQYDLADALYLGGILNGIPNQTVQLTNTGITVTSPNAVTINAPAINLDNAGTALALLNNNLLTWLSAHTHSGVTTGAGVSGAPVVAIPSTVSTTVLKAQ